VGGACEYKLAGSNALVTSGEGDKFSAPGTPFDIRWLKAMLKLPLHLLFLEETDPTAYDHSSSNTTPSAKRSASRFQAV
jgi:hypothetical protein